jgi:hypothetical protein
VGFVNRKSSGINYAAWCPTPGSTAQDTLMSALPEYSGGFQWGPDGNAYVGALLRSASHAVPQGYASDWAYSHGVGSIMKVAPHSGAWADSGSMATETRQAHNVAYIYKEGLAPYSWTSDCVCRSPRFDVDPFGRLFVPNAVTGKVAVVDNNDNPILSFGDYGNTDARDPASMVPSNAIPLLWPTGVASSEDYIYVTDMGNERLARVKMNYVLDNLPWMSGGTGAEEPASGALPVNQMAVSPNPFYPQGRIYCILGGSARIRVEVFSAGGRLIRTLVSGEVGRGRSIFTWDGRDEKGALAASGLYVFSIRSRGFCMTRKVVFAR